MCLKRLNDIFESKFGRNRRLLRLFSNKRFNHSLCFHRRGGSDLSARLNGVKLLDTLMISQIQCFAHTVLICGCIVRRRLRIKDLVRNIAGRLISLIFLTFFIWTFKLKSFIRFSVLRRLMPNQSLLNISFCHLSFWLVNQQIRRDL